MAGEGRLGLEGKGGSRRIWEDPVGHCKEFGFNLPMRILSRGLA